MRHPLVCIRGQCEGSPQVTIFRSAFPVVGGDEKTRAIKKAITGVIAFFIAKRRN
jgi:hypothetical protein